MADFKVINTQEEFDTAIKDRLERQDRKTREEFDGWTSPTDLTALTEKHQAEIAALNEAHAKEIEKYAGYDAKMAEQETKIHSLEVAALKTRIASEKRLPLDASDFLQGDDEKSISASAERLLKIAGTNASQSRGYTRDTEAGEADGVVAAFKKLNPNLKF